VSPASAGLQSPPDRTVAAGKPSIGTDPPCCLFDLGHRETEFIEGLATEVLPGHGLLAVSEALLGPVGDGGAKSTVPVEKKERTGSVSGHGRDHNGAHCRPGRREEGGPDPGGPEFSWSLLGPFGGY
jgi:hypothetical protein